MGDEIITIKKSRPNIYIIVFIFLFMYSPWLLSINISHILVLIALAGVFLNLNRAIYLLQKTQLSKLLLIFIFSFCYLAFTVIINNENIFNLYPYMLLFIEVPIIILYLVLYFDKHRYSFNSVLNIIIVVSMIQAILGISAFLFEDVKTFLIELVINNISEADRNKVIGFAWYRFNGLSGFLNSTTPVNQVIVASICLYKGIYFNQKKYLILVPFLIFSAIINARIAFVIIIFSIILLLLFSRNVKGILKIFGLLLLIPLISYPFSLMVEEQTGYVGIWIQRGLTEVLGIFIGSSQGTETINALLGDHLVFPGIIGFLFGTGHDIYGTSRTLGFASDIGFINSIWFGGIGLTIFLVVGFLWYYQNLNKLDRESKLFKFLYILFIGTFLLCNFKGNVVSYNDFIVLSLLLTSSSLALNKN
jgi:hypothetical protein